MTEKSKIHPTVDGIYLDVLEKDGISPREAIEMFAVYRATNKMALNYEKRSLQDERDRLEREIKDRQKRIDEIDSRLYGIKKSLNEYNPSDSKNNQKAIQNVMTELKLYAEKQEKGKWNMKKLTLKDIKDICRNNNAPFRPVLSTISKEYGKKWIQDYPE